MSQASEARTGHHPVERGATPAAATGESGAPGLLQKLKSTCDDEAPHDSFASRLRARFVIQAKLRELLATSPEGSEELLQRLEATDDPDFALALAQVLGREAPGPTLSRALAMIRSHPSDRCGARILGGIAQAGESRPQVVDAVIACVRRPPSARALTVALSILPSIRGAWPDGAEPRVLRLATSPDNSPAVRQKAWSALRARPLGAASRVAAWRTVRSSSEHYALRASAVAALAHRGSESDRKELREIAESDPSELFQRAALRALALWTPDVTPPKREQKE